MENKYDEYPAAGSVKAGRRVPFYRICAARRPLLVALGAFFLAQVFQLRAADSLPHPILNISGSGSGASTVTNIAESTYTNNFTPRTPPRNDAQGFVPAVVSGDTGWSWSSSTPNQITSTPSGIIFPNTNVAYPLRTQVVAVFLTTATNNLTTNVNAIYYNKAGSTTSKSMVINLIDMHKRDQLRSDFNKLAPAYINSGGTPATRDNNFARRIAVSLLDWARWHPRYYLTAINSPTYIDVTPNYSATTGGFGPQRASDHNGLAHEWQSDELLAFDAIYSSVALTNMNAEMSYDVRQYICDNLFFDEGDFLINHIPVDIAIQSNLSGPYAVLPQVARVLDRPDYIVWLDTYLDATVRQKIRRDGALEEGEGYSIGYLNSNQDAAQNTSDYFLTRAATNSLLFAISNRAKIYNTSLTYGQAQWSFIALPSGQLPSFGDTPFNNYFTARNAGNSAIMPAYGTVSMGVGSSSSTAVQVNQNFSGDNNHMRADMAAWVLWAFNNEYLGNIRYYNGSVGRNFGEQMLAYNTVQIDRVNLTPYTDADTSGNGNLTIYEPGNNGLEMTEIDGQRSYSGKASRFQRLLLLNTVDQAKPYVVDVFRVTGGTTHDYMFHGSVRWTQSGQCSFPLVTNNNLYPMLEGSETWDPSTDTPYYGFWRGVSSNSAPGNFQLVYADSNRASARDTKLWMTADPNTYNVYLGWTPVPARDNTVPTNFFNSLGLTRPSAIIRHRITSGTLQDLFVSVTEPFNVGVSNIISVERLPMSGTANESVGLKITFKDGRTDTCIVNLQNPRIAGASGGAVTVSTVDGQYSLTGRVGFHSERPNADPRVWTINATDFKYPNRELSTPSATYYSGLIAGETRKFNGDVFDAFTTATPLPTNTVLRGKLLSLTHGSMSGTTNISEMFKIDQVVLTNGLYYICFTNDHFLEITNGVTSREQVAPLRSFTTSNSFEIVLTAFAGQISPIADQNISPGGNSGALAFSFGNLGTTSGSSLQVSVVSSNATLIPNLTNNLFLTGSGTNRTLTVTPAAGQNGASVVTISVTDGVWTNSRSFNVAVGNFAVVTSPSSQSVIAGNAVNYTNVVAATNGSGTISFSLNGLPAGAAANFVPATTTDASTNVLNITTSSNTTPAGTYPLTITATAGGQISSNSVTLVVNVVSQTPGWSTWIGGSGTGNYWSDNVNWSSPLQAGNSLAFGGILRVSNTNDTPAGNLYSNIVFNSGAVAFTLNGNSITLAQNITNNSSSQQTIDLSINYASSRTLNGGAGGLVIAGGWNNTANTGTPVTNTFTGLGTLVNNLSAPTSTNIFLTSAGANWTIADNASSLPISILGALNVYNGGTINFGTADSAPNLTLTGNDGTGLGQRQQIGNSTGTSTLNIVNGTLTFADRMNVGNGTGGAVLNVSGGTLNIAGAGLSMSDNNAATIGSITVSDGLLHLDAGTFYVSTRGTGTLTVNGGQVDARTLDVCRAISSSGSSVHGTVNLNGGTLTADRVATATANSAAGGTPTAVFNFNGGTLKATSSSATWFLGGSAGGSTPVPIIANVKSGGAIIDDGGNAITVGEPLQHDPSLGVNPDGGLFKLNSGTLTLASTNSYNGNTTISNGILALSGLGAITNSAGVSIAAGAALDASARGDGTLNLVAGQILSGLGAVRGNAVINGAISPGAEAAGSITNYGSTTFGAGGSYVFDMADAVGQAGTNWDLLAITNVLNVQSTVANPFVIQLRSIDANLNDNNPGAADFGNASGQNWVIATAGGGIANFAANKFTVDNSQFQNDLAGGYFIVQTNGNSLLLTFVANNPPSANDSSFYLPSSGVLQIPISSLASLWSDPDGDPVQFAGVNSSSANGSNNVNADGTNLYFTGMPNLADTITYTIGDLRTNPPAIYRPGDTQRTATGVIHILPPPPINIVSSDGSLIFSGSNGKPASMYYVLASTNVALPLSQWTIIGTNQVDANGNFGFTNTPDPNLPQTFYLLKLQ